MRRVFRHGVLLGRVESEEAARAQCGDSCDGCREELQARKAEIQKSSRTTFPLLPFATAS